MRLVRILPVLGFGLICLIATVRTGSAVPGKLGDNSGSNSHPHNLSSLSNSAVNAAAGESDQICIFCHTPHGATPAATPLWNRKDPDMALSGFPLYGSGTGLLEIESIGGAKYTNSDPMIQYPNGSTRMCMSCHDGATAIGTVLNGVTGVNIAPSLTTMADESPQAVVDLASSHPVSFVYDSNVITVLQARPGHGSFQAPPAGWLDSENRMQCTSCHDPHVNTRGAGYNLPMWAHYTGVENTDYATTCNSCHGAGAYSIPTPLDPGAGHQGGF